MDGGGLRAGWCFAGGRQLIAEPGEVAGAFFPRSFPGYCDEGGGDGEFEEKAHF